MLTRPQRILVILAGVFALSMAACASNKQVVLSPSLAPVDLSKPMVRYQPIQGTSCVSVIEALWDMKRLVGVDGYVEVTVEHAGCWVATAYPFTYGTEAKPIHVRNRAPMPSPAHGARAPAPSEPEVAAAAPAPSPAPSARRSRTRSSRRSTSAPPPRRRAAAAAPAPVAAPALNRGTCEPVCRSFGKHAGATAFIQGVVTDRCIARCVSGDQAYFDCARSARDVSGVQRCNSR